MTALPMLFVGMITLTGSYEMFWMFLKKAGTLAGRAGRCPLSGCSIGGIGGVLGHDRPERQYQAVVWLCGLEEAVYISEVVVMAGGGAAGRMQTAIHRDKEKGFKLPHGIGCC